MGEVQPVAFGADVYLSTAEVAQRLGLSEGSLANQRSKGTGMPYVRIGSSVRYSWAAVQEYLAANTVTPSVGQVAA